MNTRVPFFVIIEASEMNHEKQTIGPALVVIPPHLDTPWLKGVLAGTRQEWKKETSPAQLDELSKTRERRLRGRGA